MFTGQSSGACCTNCSGLGQLPTGAACPTPRTDIPRWRLAALVAGAAVVGVAGAAWYFSSKAKLQRRYFSSRFERRTAALPVPEETMSDVVFSRRR